LFVPLVDGRFLVTMTRTLTSERAAEARKAAAGFGLSIVFAS
jgi:hypothetical protein